MTTRELFMLVSRMFTLRNTQDKNKHKHKKKENVSLPVLAFVLISCMFTLVCFFFFLRLCLFLFLRLFLFHKCEPGKRVDKSALSVVLLHPKLGYRLFIAPHGLYSIWSDRYWGMGCCHTSQANPHFLTISISAPLI